MAIVYPILNRCVQAFTPICRLAETELYTPIIQGAKLQTSGSIARNASLEQLLNISSRVEEILNSDVDMMDTHNENGQNELSKASEDIEVVNNSGELCNHYEIMSDEDME